jgi:hypothetical protein
MQETKGKSREKKDEGADKVKVVQRRIEEKDFNRDRDSNKRDLSKQGKR